MAEYTLTYDGKEYTANADIFRNQNPAYILITIDDRGLLAKFGAEHVFEFDPIPRQDETNPERTIHRSYTLPIVSNVQERAFHLSLLYNY